MSPYGHGEWTDLDFQAIMCGCLVIKAGADSFKAYPNVFEADNMALSVKPDWSDLKEAVQRVMQVKFFTQDSKVFGALTLALCRAECAACWPSDRHAIVNLPAEMSWCSLLCPDLATEIVEDAVKQAAFPC